MKPLPMPIRIAAGLVATALEEAHELPRKLTEFPVTAVSQALQVSMRLQQKVTDLAIKGDQALGSLRPVPESPSWARFDEDEEFTPQADHDFDGFGESGNGTRLDEPYAPTTPKVTPVRILPDLEPDQPGDAAQGADDTENHTSTQQPDPSEVPVPRESPEPARVSSDATDAPTHGTATTTPAGGPTDPPGLTQYEQWTLAQLRGRFRRLSLQQLQALLIWETAHRDRPAYVTMLSNRIASITGQ